ncbi:phosphoglycerate mutase-like protein [Paxillus ammoniavirescens]|nr:phosphoglycerate mutase-like protein [Paxillus ammoniavirescens]
MVAESRRVDGTLLVEEPLDVEGYPETPAGIKLEQVHVYVRHGERTPVRARMADPPASIPEIWQMCTVARRFRETVDSTATHGGPGAEGLWFKKGVETRDGRTAANVCLLGDLTDIGKESTYKFGTALRKLYVDKLGFLPGTLQSENQAYFRSTNLSRTIESIEHIVHGLYPQTHCAADVIPLILVRNKIDETIISNILSCPQLGLLESQFAAAAAARWNPRLQTLDKKLSKYINGKPIRVDGSPRTSGILDTVRSAAAHGLEVPDHFWDPEVIDLIEAAVSDEWFSIFKSEEGRRLGMGRLLAEVSTRMQNKIERAKADPLKILVYGTHDSTLAALCSTFDVFDDKWPPFTSSVTFELFKKQSQPERQSSLQTLLGGLWKTHSAEEHYIRMRYKNKNMVLPICAEEGKHLPGSPEFCTFSAFQQRVKELTPVNWTAECSPRT